MLKLLSKAESSLIIATVRIFQGSKNAFVVGYSTDKTLDDIEILYDSPHFLVINKSYDVIVNHRDQDRPSKL